MPPSPSFEFRGLLFDLDGTLVNSIAAVERAWATWAVEHGFDPEFVVLKIHGRRAIDSIRAIAPELEAESAFARIEHLEATDTKGVVPVAGAREFLARLHEIPWGIVTSGTRTIAVPRLHAAGIPLPNVFVTADQVKEGKPDPAPYLEGALRLHLEPSSIVVFEDTVAGVQSAHRAGMKVVALHQGAADVADACIDDFTSISIIRGKDGFALTIENHTGQIDDSSV